MDSAVKRLAKKMAEETRRQAEILNCQAMEDFAFANLQPWPDKDFTRLSAIQKRDKAQRLIRIASQFEKGHKNGTGPGSHPGPVITMR